MKVTYKERPFVADFLDVKANLYFPEQFVSFLRSLMKEEQQRMSFALYANLLFLQTFVRAEPQRFKEMAAVVLEA